MWDSPNSVTIVAISAQTAADEELANFLTRSTLRTHQQLLESPFFSNGRYLLPKCAMEMVEVPELFQ